MSARPEPFTLNVPDTAIADLRERLARTRFPDQAPGEPWAYGTNVDYLRGLVEYWRTAFDWRAQEARLNAFPQFKAPLHDIDVHFLHVPGKGPNPCPLLLMHGWPGSVFEFLDLIPRLTDPAQLRRRSGGRVHRRRAVAAGLRAVVPSGPEALRHRGDRRLPGRPDDRDARLSALRRAGRRLGRHHRVAHGLRACGQADRHPCQSARGAARDRA